MLARFNRTPVIVVALLGVFFSLSLVAHAEGESPSLVTNHYLRTAQRFAKIWVETKPWPSGYRQFLHLAREEFAPLLSQQALDELIARPDHGPEELQRAANDPQSEDKNVYEGMMACVAGAHFTVLSEKIVGDRATVDVETTVTNAFGSGKVESFQDQLVLVRENGRWVLTPEAFKTFAF